MKNGQAWGKKRHIWPAVPFNTTDSYAVVVGLEDVSVEDLEHWTLWVRIGTPASVSYVTIEGNEVPDAPAGDWWELLGYPQQISTVTGFHRACFKEGEYHKRIRVRVRSDESCACTVESVALVGWGPWVELKE